MKRNDFCEFLTRFAVQPIPATFNRHVYLWMGEADDLLSKSPVGFIKKLDLHVLSASLTKTPIGDKSAGRELSDTVDEWISKNFSVNQQQKALLVTGLDLFFRYRLPLSTFFRLANENVMIILVLSALDVNFRPTKSLPGYVQFAPHAILKYVASEIPEEAIVKEE
jgi:hypothetical protein